MLIHGGFNSEAKIVLDDFNLYDLEADLWAKVKVVMNGQIIESDAKYGGGSAFDEETQAKTEQLIGMRYGHCIVAVFD